MQSDDVKARLRDNTEELIARGGFGSPTMFINESDMYFGNDRLVLVEAALMAAQNQKVQA
jgi:2-hydroxychromene-2-carboxylate isomerase